jgi:hypothetical protein
MICCGRGNRSPGTCSGLCAGSYHSSPFAAHRHRRRREARCGDAALCGLGPTPALLYCLWLVYSVMPRRTACCGCGYCSARLKKVAEVPEPLFRRSRQCAAGEVTFDPSGRCWTRSTSPGRARTRAEGVADGLCLGQFRDGRRPGRRRLNAIALAASVSRPAARRRAARPLSHLPLCLIAAGRSPASDLHTCYRLHPVNPGGWRKTLSTQLLVDGRHSQRCSTPSDSQPGTEFHGTKPWTSGITLALS